MYKLLKRTLNTLGVDIQRYRPPQPPFLIELLELYQVDMIFDIGANIGMSAEWFRQHQFQQSIVSFEPVSHLFQELQAKASDDPLWYAEKLALGDVVGEHVINVSGGHAGASSLLKMTDNVLLNAPDQRCVATEKIQVETLDNMLSSYYPSGDKAFLKLDVQGYEKRVLMGGLNNLSRVIGLKIEMSLVENYQQETLLTEMIPYLYELGFRLMHFQDGWRNGQSRELYQVDGVFFRQ